MNSRVVAVLSLFLLCVWVSNGFLYNRGISGNSPRTSTQRPSLQEKVGTKLPADASASDKVNHSIRPSVVDKARTITHVCTSGTLSTISSAAEDHGVPFGSYVDYMLDGNGWPILLLSDQSIHTLNIRQSPSVSLFCQLPRASNSQAAAGLSRVTMMGSVEPVPEADLSILKLAFILTHQYAEQIVDSPRFAFFRIKPEKIFFSGGFGVQSTWVDVDTYQLAKPDVMATEVPTVLSRVNSEKQAELVLLCKYFLDVENPEFVRIQAIDRLGIDLRVKTGDYTDEYRIGFRYEVNSAEDAKSEMFKLFQEAWERDNGYYYTDSSPPCTKYAEDMLRKDTERSMKK